ncbi:MAG: hypothetical protein E4G95_00580 [Bacteroidia bacterium]|nr:MAG: hypothetical protein E4G95_00580 [Bacteroidia bacterium]
MDFTLVNFRELLISLKNAGYQSVMPDEINQVDSGKYFVLRHDVDRSPGNSLATALIEKELGFRGIYYFRMVPASLDTGILINISVLSHEIGYHYEDLAAAGGDHVKAWAMFRKNLDELRKYYPVKHCCMHGSPLSKYDNRLLWKYYDYRDLGIICEPYLDIDISTTLYLTDTGRRWNGNKFSIRDKAVNRGDSIDGNNVYKWVSTPVIGSSMRLTRDSIEFQSKWSFRNTGDIIKAIQNNILPHKVAFTTHPQRWNDSHIRWALELVSQKIKNSIKYLLVNNG